VTTPGLKNDIIILFCIINIKTNSAHWIHTRIYLLRHDEEDNGRDILLWDFLRRLKILETTLDTFPNTGGRWASGRLLTSVPDPFVAARAGGKPRKENLLTLNNKSGRSFVPPSALSEYSTERYKRPMRKHRSRIPQSIINQ